MTVLANLVGMATVLGLLVAACVYVFSPGHARKLFKNVVISLAVVLFIPVLFQALAKTADTLSALVGLALVSVLAYAVRERRLGRRERPRRTGGVERKPLLPRREVEE